MNYGIILINKPIDRSSFSIVAQLRRIIGIKKIGHTGTLDPFATGLLPICIGKATRIVDRLITDSKTYEVTMLLGSKYDTGDNTGELIENMEVPESIDNNKITEYVLNLKEQVPPRFSAIKVNGQRAYKLARSNKEFSMESRPISIASFEITEVKLPHIKYTVSVSKGTYIRSLSETIAEFIGTVGVTTELCRTRVGRFTKDLAVDPEELTIDNWVDHLIPIPSLFPQVERLTLDSKESEWFFNGRHIVTDVQSSEELIAVDEDSEFLGFCNITEGVIIPTMVFTSGEKYINKSENI
ncbi:MAG: tRNA pseudouridine(55) synthase TruB [Candidatus Zophobacter franzmannii]|nr:tRNA pseudouridine(55) synthase TruB [Candidatus Zophobacter franzmannii]